MNVIGVGVDLVDLERVSRLLSDKGAHAMHRFFTDEERAYLATRPDPTGHAAARSPPRRPCTRRFNRCPVPARSAGGSWK